MGFRGRTEKNLEVLSLRGKRARQGVAGPGAAGGGSGMRTRSRTAESSLGVYVLVVKLQTEASL